MKFLDDMLSTIISLPNLQKLHLDLYEIFDSENVVSNQLIRPVEMKKLTTLTVYLSMGYKNNENDDFCSSVCDTFEIMPILSNLLTLFEYYEPHIFCDKYIFDIIEIVSSRG